jgi:single-strand DNA-binding protein
MASLNKVILMGNLTRDVEMRFTPGGLGIASFGMAMSRKFRDKQTNELREEATFVDVDVFGKSAEIAQKYLSKGRPVFIEGRLKFDQWEDKQTGQKRSKLKVVAENIQFVGPPPGAQGGAPRPAGATGAQASRAPQRQAPQQTGGDPDFGDGGPPPEDLDIQEENIPF